MIYRAVLIVFSIIASFVPNAFGQGEQPAPADWSVRCVEGIDGNRDEIPCNNFSQADGRLKVVRELPYKARENTARSTLTFKRHFRDQSRFLKIISVTPGIEEDNGNQKYWFKGSVQGYGGEGFDLIFVTLALQTRNREDPGNGGDGFISPGTYTGVMDLEDDTTGEKFTFELQINVRNPG